MTAPGIGIESTPFKVPAKGRWRFGYRQQFSGFGGGVQLHAEGRLATYGIHARPAFGCAGGTKLLPFDYVDYIMQRGFFQSGEGGKSRAACCGC